MIYFVIGLLVLCLSAPWLLLVLYLQESSETEREKLLRCLMVNIGKNGVLFPESEAKDQKAKKSRVKSVLERWRSREDEDG